MHIMTVTVFKVWNTPKTFGHIRGEDASLHFLTFGKDTVLTIYDL